MDFRKVLFSGAKPLIVAAAVAGSQAASAVSLSYQSIDTPALTVFNGQIIMAYAGTDSNHRLNYAASSDGVNFTQATDTNNRTGSGPGIAAFNGKTYAAFAGINDKKINIYSSTDGLHYTNQTVPNGNWNTLWRVTMASGGGYLYLAWLGQDNQIYVIRTSDGVSWQSYTSILKFPSPNGNNVYNGPVYPPTLATDSTGAVQLVYTQRFYYTFNNPPTYQIVKVAMVGGGSSVTCRAYVNATGIQAGLGFLPGETLMPWYASQGGGQIALDVNGGSCATGTTYPTTGSPTNGSYYGLSGVAPAVIGFNGHAFLYWTGTDNAQHINVVEAF